MPPTAAGKLTKLNTLFKSKENVIMLILPWRNKWVFTVSWFWIKKDDPLLSHCPLADSKERRSKQAMAEVSCYYSTVYHAGYIRIVDHKQHTQLSPFSWLEYSSSFTQISAQGRLKAIELFNWLVYSAFISRHRPFYRVPVVDALVCVQVGLCNDGILLCL